MNDGIPEKDQLYGTDWGRYCDIWDKSEKEWCYVDEGCKDAQASIQFKGSGLFWSEGACEDDHKKVCMAYSKPRPKIKPCPEDESNNSKCAQKTTQKKCERMDGCKWDGGECVGDGGSGPCQEAMPSNPVISNNLP